MSLSDMGLHYARIVVVPVCLVIWAYITAIVAELSLSASALAINMRTLLGKIQTIESTTGIPVGTLERAYTMSSALFESTRSVLLFLVSFVACSTAVYVVGGARPLFVRIVIALLVSGILVNALFLHDVP